jgi:transcriptional regulator with XRE-family HTH domain
MGEVNKKWGGGGMMTILKEMRKKRGLTLAQLALRSRVDEAFLSKLERGLKMAHPGIQERIAGVFETCPVELFRKDGLPRECGAFPDISCL